MKDFISLVSQIFKILDNNIKKLPIIIILTLLLSFIEISSLIIIGPFIEAILNNKTNVIFPSNILNNFFSINNNSSNLIIFAFFLILLFFLRMLFAIIINWNLIKFVLSQQVFLRLKLINNYSKLEFEEYINKNSGEYIRATTILTEQYANCLNFLLKIISELILLLITLVFLFYVNPFILIFSFTIFLTFFLIYDKIFKNKLYFYGKVNNENSKIIYQLVNEFFNGFKEIKILNKSSFFYSRIKKLSNQIANVGVKSSIISSSPRYILEFILISLICSMLIYYYILDLSIVDILPTLSIFALASTRIIPSITQLTHSFTKVRFGRNAVQIIFKELINDYTLRKNKIQNNNSNLGSTFDFKKIELKNISYNYPNTNNLIFDNINLEIAKGEFVAIVGKSGSGKTTLIDIILGLLPLKTGEIYLNNQNFSNGFNPLFSLTTYLPQDFFIIDDTVETNITLQENEKNSSRLFSALESSNLINNEYEFKEIKNKIVGDKGIKLSGGQKHRVALARSFYHNRKILILDEMSSSLDKTTEDVIINELIKFKKELTIIFITHSKNVMKICDKVYEVKNKKIYNLKK